MSGWVAAQVGPSVAGTIPEAGEYRVAHWTTAEGLPQNTVTDMVQLANGELWLATFGGLARFDGHGFHVVDIASDEGLPANRIVSLAVAGADAFWFLTQQGHLGRIDRGRPVSLVPPPSGSVDTLSLFADRRGRLYCKAVDGSVWQTDGTRAWEQILAESGTGGMFRAFATTAEGETWTGWGNQLVRLDTAPPRPWMALPYTDPDIFPSVDGGLWLGLKRGLGRVFKNRFQHTRVQPPIGGQVAAIEPASADTLWVASGNEVSRLDRGADGSWRRTSLPLGLTDEMVVRSMMLDARGSLWIGTNGGGLYRVNRPPIRHLGVESGLREVTALVPDGEGGAFVSSGCRGLFHLDLLGVATPIPLRDPADEAGVIGGPCGISLGEGGRGRVWARARSHLFIVRREGFDVRRVLVDVPPVEGPVTASTNGALWVVSRTGRVQLVSPEGRVVRDLSLPAPLVSAAAGPDGTLWVGGDGAVYRVERGDAIRQFGPREHVPRGLVRDVVPEADGTVWIGTYGGGLGRLRAGRVARLTVEHGLPDNSISRILDDGRGRVWISTNRGAAVVDRDELHRAADGRLDRLAAVVLGPERGIPEANFGSPAGFVDANGRLWFGTIDGVAIVDAAKFPFNSTPPGIRIEGVWADNHPLAVGATVRVPALAARVRVAFTAFQLHYPERIRFRFRVEDVDVDWLDVGAQRAVDWTPPGPGRHRFLVEARNEDGVWSAPAEIVLDVLPAWWQTTAFRAAATLNVILVIFAAFRLGVRRVERRHAQRVRLLEEQRRAAERVANLRAQLEHVSRVALAGELGASLAHEVSQPLGAIVNNAEAGRRNLTQYLQRPEQLNAIFDDIVADGMRASEVVRGLRGFLQPRGSEASLVDLSGLVREMLPLVRRELTENGVNVELALAETLPAVEGHRVQLGQVVVNLVMNACEALAEVAGDRRVTVRTTRRDGRVELAVRDNGPGLAPEVTAHVFEPFVTTKPGGLGMGLAICRAIAEAHDGHIRAEAVPAGGLEVTLSLPAVQEEASRP